MKALLRLAVPVLVVLILAGCDTPGGRIKKNPELYNSFAAEAQENVRAGKVRVGYTRDMVYIALGKPDREYTRTTEDGGSEIWSYTDIYTTRERQRVDGDFRVRDNSGVYRTVHDSVWVDINREHEYESLRIEFDGDAVSAIEEVKTR